MNTRDILLGCTLGVLASALLFLGTGCDTITRFFGPPSVELGEEYEGQGTEDFDHARLDAILRAHVDRAGLVDYEAIRRAPAELDAYIAELARANFDALTRDAKLAFLINAYNAWTLRLILDHSPVESIKDIASSERWDAVRWSVAGTKLSLNQLEHEWLRKRFREPRMHFAIICASIGCPPLRNEAYTAEKLEAQLEAQCRTVSTDGSRWLRIDGDTVQLTQIYRWFAGDFEQVAGSALRFVARYNARVAEILEQNARTSPAWLDYDWQLNRALKTR